MYRALLSLSILLVPAVSTATDACPPIERTAGPPVYVIVYGYPFIRVTPSRYRREPDPLTMVDDDVLHMARFFQALGPRQMHMHGAPTRDLLIRSSMFGVRPPTWRSLRQSVAEVVADLDRHPSSAGEPQIYIYLSGHGARGRGPHGKRMLFYGRREGEGKGYNGIIDSALFAEHILAPLAARGRVHVIADTCFSYVLLKFRSYDRPQRTYRPIPVEYFHEEFAEAFPDVGLHLATRTVTHEDDRGGVFTHVMRSIAMGPGDADGDGIITYREMKHALDWETENEPGLYGPEVIAPGLDEDAVFIRWDQSPAAQVCAPVGRGFQLHHGRHIFSTVPERTEPMTLWLPAGHVFTMGDIPIKAVDGRLLPLRR